jgi:hypothetical protein
MSLAKCPCVHCGGTIEFDSDAAGQDAECPHCHKRTWVDLPDRFSFRSSKSNQPSLPELAPKTDLPAPKPKNKISAGRATGVFMLIIGFALITRGCGHEGRSENGINQVYASVEFSAGWIIVGLAVIADLLVTLIKNQSR